MKTLYRQYLEFLVRNHLRQADLSFSDWKESQAMERNIASLCSPLQVMGNTVAFDFELSKRHTKTN